MDQLESAEILTKLMLAVLPTHSLTHSLARRLALSFQLLPIVFLMDMMTVWMLPEQPHTALFLDFNNVRHQLLLLCAGAWLEKFGISELTVMLT